MKIAVVGANGNLGSRIVAQALARGHEVKGFILEGEWPFENAEVCHRDLFHMTREDLEDCDVMISAFGSGFKADPALNYKAFIRYIELNSASRRHLITISGSGSLYADETHTGFVYDTPEHPSFMRGISMHTRRGTEALKMTEELNWTAMTPIYDFKQEEGSGKYVLRTDETAMPSHYVTYDDMAKAMLDAAETDSHNKEMVTVETIA